MAEMRISEAGEIIISLNVRFCNDAQKCTFEKHAAQK
jgi:hypothetical protein